MSELLSLSVAMFAGLMMTRLLGKLPTAKYGAAELQQAVKMHLGRLNFSLGTRMPSSSLTSRCMAWSSVS